MTDPKPVATRYNIAGIVRNLSRAVDRKGREFVSFQLERADRKKIFVRVWPHNIEKVMGSIENRARVRLFGSFETYEPMAGKRYTHFSPIGARPVRPRPAAA